MEETFVMHKKLKKKRVVFSRLKRQLLKHIWLTRAGICFLVLLGFFLTGFFLSYLLAGTMTFNYFTFVKNFIFTPEDEIASISGRTNILILGKGGAGHDAPDLTDTIVFTAVSHTNPSITLISLPRDIWIPEIRAKLNSAYYWGNQKTDGGGLILAKSAVEEVAGQAVQYGLVIDFSGFKEIVDVIGGIEVDVRNSFVDEKYPIAEKENDDCGGDKEYKCRYETISFTKGMQIMDGEVALKFVRSRNAQGDEGTDLARAARQEIVISAIKEKTLNKSVIFSLIKLTNLKKVIERSVETDISPNVAAILLRRFFQSRNNIKSVVLNESLLMNPPKSAKYDNLYVFIPKKEGWDQIHQWVEELLD